MSDLIYMPTFRARQQEIQALTTFGFHEQMWPMLEIVKEKDRTNSSATFAECYRDIIQRTSANKVFVDLPVNLKESGSMQDEILQFSRSVIANVQKRSEHLLSIGSMDNKVIPVISSYLMKTGEADTLQKQFNALRGSFPSIAIRVYVSVFKAEFENINANLTKDDFLILDVDNLTPNPNLPAFKVLLQDFEKITVCPKILLKSAINSEIQNVSMEHGSIIFEADNSHIEGYKAFGAKAFGDYVGIKKDDLTAGGTISPGFILYDATENTFYGFKGQSKEDRSLADFENIIVPAVLESPPVKRMQQAPIRYLTDENIGWKILNNISEKKESGKSQAKFKRISMEHYLFCIKQNLIAGKY